MGTKGESRGKGQLACPACGKHSMRRDFRKGLLEHLFFPLFHYFPWECAHCRARKLFNVRGRHKSSHSE